MKIKKMRRNNKTIRSGAAAVEAALLLPMLALVTLGSVDIAQYINLSQMVAQASREGARIASRNETQTVGEIKAAVLGYFEDSYPQLTAEAIANAVHMHVRDKDGTYVSNGDLTTIVSGDSMSVEIRFDYAAIRWMGGLDYWDDDSTTITYCRRE